MLFSAAICNTLKMSKKLGRYPIYLFENSKLMFVIGSSKLVFFNLIREYDLEYYK
jgi:hypothetical protein